MLIQLPWSLARKPHTRNLVVMLVLVAMLVVNTVLIRQADQDRKQPLPELYPEIVENGSAQGTLEPPLDDASHPDPSPAGPPPPAPPAPGPPPTRPPDSCPTCSPPHQPPTPSLPTNSSQSSTCYWPQWPTSAPLQHHTVTFLIPHVVGGNGTSRTLDHLSTFSTHDVRGEVRTVIAVIDRDNNTICIGPNNSSCVERQLLSLDRANDLRAFYNGTSQERKTEFWVAAMQQALDFVGVYNLYQDQCSMHDSPVLMSFLDNDMATCPGFGYHLAGIRQYAQRSYVGRSGHPFGLRASPGSSGFFVRPEFMQGMVQAMQLVADGGGEQWRGAADYTMDRWAKGEVTAPGFENEVGVGLFQYHVMIFDHLGNDESYFWSSEYVKQRQVSQCGSALYWRFNKAKNNVDECFGQAWRPCTEDKWGEWVPGSVNTYREDVPDAFIDALVEQREAKRQKAAEKEARALAKEAEKAQRKADEAQRKADEAQRKADEAQRKVERAERKAVQQATKQRNQALLVVGGGLSLALGVMVVMRRRRTGDNSGSMLP